MKTRQYLFDFELRVAAAVLALGVLFALVFITFTMAARAETVPAVPEPFAGRLSIIEGTTIDIECLDGNLLEWRIDGSRIRINCNDALRDEDKQDD